MSQVIRVSKPGTDVLTATSLDDFYFHSDYALLKVHSSGTFNLNSQFGLSGTAGTITHNLGYVPYALIFSQMIYDITAGSLPLRTTQYYQHDYVDNAVYMYTTIGTANLQINIGCPNAIAGTPVTGFYYIFKDQFA